MNRVVLVIASVAVFISATFFAQMSSWPPVFLYYSTGIFGMYIIAKKGYFTKISIILFLLVGWWFIIILIGLGPVTLLVATFLPEKRRCPLCRELVSKNAVRCPHCQGDIENKGAGEILTNNAVITVVAILMIGLAILFAAQSITNKLFKPSSTQSPTPTPLPTPLIPDSQVMQPVETPVTSDSEIVTMNLGEGNVSLLVADTPEKRQQGITKYEKLPEGIDGILVHYPNKQTESYWNSNLYFDIDVHWLDGGTYLGKDFLPAEAKQGIVTIVPPASYDTVALVKRPDSSE